MHRTVLMAFSLLALVGACTWGPRAKSQAFAVTPAGASANYQIDGQQVLLNGELFAVDSNAIFIHSDRLRRIPWERLAFIDLLKLAPRYDVRGGARPDSAKLARLRLMSRFPQGLSGPLLTQVLTALKQDALEEVP